MRLSVGTGIGPLRISTGIGGRRRRSSGGIGGGAGFLVILALVFAVKYWYVTLSIAVFALILWAIVALVMNGEEKNSAALNKKAAMVARADAEHNALMNGDTKTGVYGQFPPATIEGVDE